MSDLAEGPTPDPLAPPVRSPLHRATPQHPTRWILLVEDDPDHVLLMRRALRPLGEDLALEVAPDGPAALARLAAPGPPPALILLDLNMPRLDGLEVLGRIRANPALAQVPTVMHTTSARDQDRVASLERGADAFFTKPVSFKQFGETLRALVSRYLQATVPPAARPPPGARPEPAAGPTATSRAGSPPTRPGDATT